MSKYPYVKQTLAAKPQYVERRPLYAHLKISENIEDEPYSAIPYEYGHKVIIQVHHSASCIIEYGNDQWIEQQENMLRQKLVRDVYKPVTDDLLELRYKCMSISCPGSEIKVLVDYIDEMISKTEI